MSVRAFLGIGLAPQVRTTLGSCGAALRETSREWRGEKWVPEENLHVTLKFLGTVAPDSLDEIVDVLRVVCEESAEYELSIGDVQAIPGLRAASMLWATLSEGESRTAELAASIDQALTTLDAPPQSRPFTAHITLARAHRPKAVPFDALDACNRALFGADARDKRMSVRGITLYSSTLTPRGALYEELAFVPFAG